MPFKENFYYYLHNTTCILHFYTLLLNFLYNGLTTPSLRVPIWGGDHKWDDTGYISPTPPPSDYFKTKIKILHHDVFHALSGLDSQKTYGPDRAFVLKNCFGEILNSHDNITYPCLNSTPIGKVSLSSPSTLTYYALASL